MSCLGELGFFLSFRDSSRFMARMAHSSCRLALHDHVFYLHIAFWSAQELRVGRRGSYLCSDGHLGPTQGQDSGGLPDKIQGAHLNLNFR